MASENFSLAALETSLLALQVGETIAFEYKNSIRVGSVEKVWRAGNENVCVKLRKTAGGEAREFGTYSSFHIRELRKVS